MDKKEQKLKRRVDREGAAMFLEEVAMGMRAGKLSIGKSAERLELELPKVLSLEIKCKSKKGKEKFGLSLSWISESQAEQDTAELVSEERPKSSPKPKPKKDHKKGHKKEHKKEHKAKKEKYKKLKNRMQDDLVALRSSTAQAGKLPDREVFEKFCADSRAMCTYRKKGEPHYEEYLGRLEEFVEAYEAADVPTLNLALESLIYMKERCHDEYK